MTDTTRLMTAAELLRLPRGRERHELWRGDLRTMPLRTIMEGLPAQRLLLSLAKHIEDRQPREVVSNVGFWLEEIPDTVLGPAVAYLDSRRVAEIDDPDGYPRVAPNLCADVVGPTELYIHVEDKIALWLARGTQLVMVINPWREVVTVHSADGSVRQFTSADMLDAGDVVRGWQMPIQELFKGLLER